ncbi:MAG: chemotaxis protein CheW [Pseudomonadota bacterium]
MGMKDQKTELKQYLSFTLGEEEFALEIDRVREVLGYPVITVVPRMPDYLRGVINLRGNVVPVVDLRLKFNMSKTQRTVDTCVVIVEAMLEGEVTVMGLLTDSVEEVTDLSASEIEPPPRMGNRLNTDFLKGMGKQGERFMLLLDIDKVLSSEELETLSTAVNIAKGAATEAAMEAMGKEA